MACVPHQLVQTMIQAAAMAAELLHFHWRCCSVGCLCALAGAALSPGQLVVAHWMPSRLSRLAAPIQALMEQLGREALLLVAPAVAETCYFLAVPQSHLQGRHSRRMRVSNQTLTGPHDGSGLKRCCVEEVEKRKQNDKEQEEEKKKKKKKKKKSDN